ncbi:MAG: PH domain-containing protein [Bacteroidales bacterium]|nr:PH domain-containing protein [Bacteroidales bacterium]
MKFKSKTNTGLVVFLLLVLGAPFFLAIHNRAWAALAIISVVILFIAHIILTTYYIIEGNTLKIRCGFWVNKTIDINSISRIRESSSIISSPASSFDRLEIKYERVGHILISQKDKIGFIKNILEINSDIEIKVKEFTRS